MKKLLLSLLFAGCSALVFAQIPSIKTSRFEGVDITGVSASHNFEVELIPSDQTSAEVTISPDLNDRLVFNISSEGIITLGMKPGTRTTKTSEMKARIYLNTLKNIKAGSNAEIQCTGTFHGEGLVVELSSNAELEGLDFTASNSVVVQCNSNGVIKGRFNTRLLRLYLGSNAEANLFCEGESAVIDLTSSSKLEIAGHANEATINAGSASRVEGGQYTIGKATLSSNSASRITVGAVDELSASAHSTSGIRYAGTPKIISLKTASLGSIKQQ